MLFSVSCISLALRVLFNFSVLKSIVERICRIQGCVRGQHGRGQGQGQGSSRPRPRPEVFEAKAKATKFCPRGVLEVEASPRDEDPHTWAFFYRATLRRERLCQVVCLSITLNALLPPLVRLCMKYCIYGIESFTY